MFAAGLYDQAWPAQREDRGLLSKRQYRRYALLYDYLKTPKAQLRASVLFRLQCLQNSVYERNFRGARKERFEAIAREFDKKELSKDSLIEAFNLLEIATHRCEQHQNAKLNSDIKNVVISDEDLQYYQPISKDTLRRVKKSQQETLFNYCEKDPLFLFNSDKPSYLISPEIFIPRFTYDPSRFRKTLGVEPHPSKFELVHEAFKRRDQELLSKKSSSSSSIRSS